LEDQVMTSDAATTTGGDGRRQRTERGRAAVTEAMIDLMFEGYLPPTAEQLAERAGVSVASVYRYFDGLDDLRQAATALYFSRYTDLFDIQGFAEGSLAVRVANLVDSRLRLYTTSEPMGRLIRIRQYEHATAHEWLAQLRATYADQIRHHFDTQLEHLGPTDRAHIVAVIATVTSFESWDQCREAHRLDDAQIRESWIGALIAAMRSATGIDD
jgi:AcrR family transcriptional regulator